MREILFRGKKTDKNRHYYFNNGWVYGDLIHSGGKYYIKPRANSVIVEGELGKLIVMREVIPETVGQYTGMTDISGNRIFEGDIVNCVYDGILRTYIVVWDKDELDFKATNGEEQYRNNFMYLPCCDEIEIIGNIHESYWKAVRKND